MDLDAYLEENAVYCLDFEATFVDGDSMTREAKEEAKGRVTSLVDHYHARYRALQNQSPSPPLELTTAFHAVEGLCHMRGLTAMLLHSQNHLRYFNLDCGDVGGALRGNNAAEVASFLKALQQQSKLETLYYNFDNHQGHEEPTYQGVEVPVDAILLAASKLPELTDICIFRTLEGPTLAPSLSTLLQNNSTLRSLTLHFNLSEPEAVVVNNYLKFPGCILQGLVLGLSGHSTLLALVEGLRLTQTLERLQLEFDPSYTQTGVITYTQLHDTIVAIGSALEDNSSLLHLFLNETVSYYTMGVDGRVDNRSLYRDTTSDDNENADKALTKLLTVNCTIRNVQILLRDFARRRNPPVVDMYIRFNANGRKDLLENIDTMSLRDWVNALAGHTNDHSWLFYVLKLMPSFFCFSPESTNNTSGNLGKPE